MLSNQFLCTLGQPEKLFRYPLGSFGNAGLLIENRKNISQLLIITFYIIRSGNRK